MAVTVTPTPDSTLARILVDFSFTNTLVTACKIERRDPGAPWVIIKSGAAFPCVAGQPKVPAYDYEAPFDVDVTYRITQVTPAGSETVTSGAVKLDSWPPDGRVGSGYTWLKDPAFPSLSMRLDEVTSLPALTYAARSGVFAVIDRPKPIGISARRQAWTGELKFTTATLNQRNRVNDLLARGQILLLATPDGYGIGNQYLLVGDVVEERIAGAVVTEPSRSWTLPLTCVDRPESLTLAPQVMRWVDVKLKYPTWDALAATGKTWAQLVEDTP